MIPKEQATKLKIVKSDSIKLLIKSFHRAKETINRVKRQFTKWEKTFANPDFDLISKIYKELIQVNGEKRHWSNSGQKILIDISPKKIYKWWPIGISKMLNLANHQGNANQTNSEINLTPVRVALKKSKDYKFQQVCGEIETILHYW